MERQILIEQLEISNILNCDDVHINFTVPESTYFIMTHPVNRNPHLKKFTQLHGKISPITLAIQMIFSAKYASIESLGNIESLYRGCIRIRFVIKNHKQNAKDIVNWEESEEDELPCTSKQALEREHNRKLREQYLEQSKDLTIVVKREFYNHPEHVSYSVNCGKYIFCPITWFHGRFFTTVEYVLPELEAITEQCNGNWMELLHNVYTDFERYNYNPFNKFIKLYLELHYQQDTFMERFTETVLEGSAVMCLKQKQELLIILNSMRNIFEFITCNEYTVWFLIPCVDSLDYIDINSLKIEDLDFNKIKTCIQLKIGTDRRRLFWQDVEHDIQDLLLIAFQIVLTLHCKQNILYLSTFDSLKTHIALQLTTAAFIEQEEQLRLNWTCQNYLQQIITTCNNYKLTVIMDYPGGVPLPLGDANIIKCKWLPNGNWTVSNESAIMPNCIDNSKEFIDTITNDLTDN